MVVPLYIAEAAPSNMRGKLVTINVLFITFGQLFASVLNGVFSHIDKDSWRYIKCIYIYCMYEIFKNKIF